MKIPLLARPQQRDAINNADPLLLFQADIPRMTKDRREHSTLPVYAKAQRARR
jgi:hypothetical protein